MTRRSMSALGITLAMGLGLAAYPQFLRGQLGGGGPGGAGGVPRASGSASEVAQLAQEDRDRRLAMATKARDLIARLDQRAHDLRESLRKAEAEVAAAKDLLADITGGPPGTAAPRALVPTAEILPFQASLPPATPSSQPPVAPAIAGWEYSNNLAWGWATATNKADRDGAKALEFARRACELTGDENPLCLDTLAAAYAEVGDYGKAVEFQAKAIRAGGADHAEEFKARLMLYLDSKPYREGGGRPVGVAPPQPNAPN